MASKAISSVEFARALEAAGVVDDLDSIARIVIDVDPRDLVKVYVERIGGPELKRVTGLLGEMMSDGRADSTDPPKAVEHAPDCDWRSAHQIPEECLHIQSACDGPVSM